MSDASHDESGRATGDDSESAQAAGGGVSADRRQDDSVALDAGSSESSASVGSTAEGHTPDERAVETEAPLTLGARLAQARRQQGLTPESAAGHLKVSTKRIEALESEQWSALPQGPYLRGFVRSYAKLLGLDAEAIVSGLDASAVGRPMTAQALLAPSLAKPFPEHSSSGADSRTPAWMAATAVICVLVALVVWASGSHAVRNQIDSIASWFGTSTHGAAAPSSNAPAPLANSESGHMSTELLPPATHPSGADTPGSGASAAPSAASSAAPSAAPSAGANSVNPIPQAADSGAGKPAAPAAATSGAAHLAPVPTSASSGGPEAVALKSSTPVAIHTPAGEHGASVAVALQFLQDAWVEARQAHGQVVVSSLYRAGSEKSFDATPPIDLVIGNAPGVTLTYQGATYDLAPYTHDRVAHVTLR